MDPSGSIEIQQPERRRGTLAAHAGGEPEAAVGDARGGQPPTLLNRAPSRTLGDGTPLAMAAPWPSLPAPPLLATRSTAPSGRSSTRSLPNISKPSSTKLAPGTPAAFRSTWSASSAPTSCNARRMCGTAAHLVDRVFPSVPARQWVLSVPFELRLLLAKNHRALSAVGRIFVREVFHWQREQAALRGIPRARGGAVCFPQRFGGSLDLNVHYHVALPDGVFTEGGGPRVDRISLQDGLGAALTIEPLTSALRTPGADVVVARTERARRTRPLGAASVPGPSAASHKSCVM